MAAKSASRQDEHAMMEAIAEQLEALPTLIGRYEVAKNRVRELEAELTALKSSQGK